MSGGFWMAPRALADMLARGRLSRGAYDLLHFLAESGADWPEGLGTTNGYLADVFGVSDKTVRRWLRELRAKDLIAYEEHERVAVFTVHLSTGLRTLLRTPLRTPETPVVSAETSAMPATEEGRNPASEQGLAAVIASSLSRARAQTETETETREAAVGAEDRASEGGASPALGALLAPLERLAGTRLVGHGLRLAAEAYEHEPEGLAALVEQFVVQGERMHSPLGALTRSLERDEHMEAGVAVRRAKAKRRVCPECEVGGGEHAIDCPTANGGER